MSKSSRASSEAKLGRSAKNAIEEILREMEDRGDIPSLPQIVVKLNAVVNDPKSSAADLANVILRDQSLTSRTLKISNSALYGSSGRRGVATVTQAVILIGFRNVARIAQGMAVFNMLDTAARDHHLLRIWMHSIACAVAAEKIARVVRIPHGEEAFVAGLLHDVGKLILLRNAPDEYRRILDETGGGEDRLEAERRVLGFTHEDVGAAVGRRWNLPDPLVEVLSGHHTFDDSEASLRNVVTLANHIANLYFAIVRTGPTMQLDDIERIASTRLGVSPACLDALLGSLRTNVDECLEIFGLDEARESKRVADLGAGSPNGDDPLQSIYMAMEADVHRKSAQLALLQQISHALILENDPDHLVPMVLEGLYVSLQLDRLALVLGDGGSAKGVQGFGPDVDDMLSRLEVGEAGHPLAEVFAKGRPLHVLDRSLPVYADLLGKWEWPARSFAAVPIPTASGVGGLLIADRGDDPLSDDDLEMMALFANQMSLALAKSVATGG